MPHILKHTVTAIQKLLLEQVEICSRLTFGHITTGDATARLAAIAETISQKLTDLPPA